MSKQIKTVAPPKQEDTGLMPAWTAEQIELIKSSIAKGATDDEFKLFCYRCKEMGLDPFKKEIYFVKYGGNAGSIIVGIDGFRKIAHRSGMLNGIERGVTRNPEGRVVAGWAKVYRKDWASPAFEEVPMSEYNTGKAMWAKMPETMIKKTAEAAALRMAFPELGNIYEPAEMDQAAMRIEEERLARIDTRVAVIQAEDDLTISNKDRPLGERTWMIGKQWYNRQLKDIPPRDLEKMIEFLDEKKKSGQALTAVMDRCLDDAKQYMAMRVAEAVKSLDEDMEEEGEP